MGTPDDLGLIADVLVEGEPRGSVGQSVPAGNELLFSFVALPSVTRPYALLPTESAVGVASIEGLGNPVTWRLRTAERILASGFRYGLSQRVLRDRVLVSAPPLDGTPRRTMLDHFRSLFGRSDLHLAVVLGAKRPNRKPVLKIVTTEGRCIGFAKIGWNDLSRALVGNEASVLQSFADDTPSPRSFTVPTVIDHRRIGDLEVLVLAPVPTPAGRNARVLRFPAVAGRELAERVKRPTEALGSSAYWARLRTRIDAIVTGSPLGGGLIAAIEGLEARYRDREIVFGAWHGDFTPWNMSRTATMLFIWDWERSGDLVPVGLDAARFDLDVRVKIHRERPRDAARRSAMSLGPTLEAMGAAVGSATLVTTLHVVEMVLRFEEARMAGVSGREPLYEAALDEMVMRLRRPGS